MLSSDQPIHVIRESRNGLFRHRWTFSLVRDVFSLDRYYFDKRPRKSEEFRTTKYYEAGYSDEGYGEWEWITLDKVPWDTELEDQVKAVLTQNLRLQSPTG